MGKKSRDKGLRFERELVNLMQSYGRAAERVPLSGAAGGRYSADVSCPVLGSDWKIEAKCRADGFAQVYKYLGLNDALIIKSDRRRPLVVLDLRRALAILNAKETELSVSPVVREAA